MFFTDGCTSWKSKYVYFTIYQLANSVHSLLEKQNIGKNDSVIFNFIWFRMDTYDILLCTYQNSKW